MAAIGWIFFSKEHREKVGTILDLLKPEGMVDELGVGVIRDVFANQMFPGISTIQTRAKYFFIVPYILLELQKLKSTQLKNRTASKYLDDREHDIIWKLGELYNHEEGIGVIGISKRRNKKDNRLMRRPSAIYWNGLTKMGFMNNMGLGVDAFVNSKAVSSIDTLISKIAAADDEQGDDLSVDFENKFGLKIPILDKDWESNLSIDLTHQEADILQYKIIDNCGGLLIGELLENNALYQIFASSNSFKDFSKKCIALPIASELKKQLTLAHDFSEVMYGAHIAYNVWVQFARYKNWDEIDDLKKWENWINNLQLELIDSASFDMSNIIQNEQLRNAKRCTKIFVMEWWDLVKNGNCTIEKTKFLIQSQEYNNKIYKSRIESQKLDDIVQNKWIGLTQLDYRFTNAKKILTDIKTGLNK